MRNVLKKTAAAVLALAMCLSFAGCYSEDKTWAAKKGDDTMPIGGYLYYLSSAYSEASSKISGDTEVLKGKVDGEDASVWIKNRAMSYLNAYYYINDKFTGLGLELTEEDAANAESATAATWTYYKDTFEPMGVAQSSFNQAYALYNVKYQKVLEKMYSEGGELALPEDELKAYYTENYYSYEYFYASLSKTGEDGNSEQLTDDEKAELKEEFEAYVKEINSGDTTVSDAANDYAYETAGESTYSAPSPSKKESLTTVIGDALAGLEDNKAGLAETTSGYYVIKKLPIADKFAETMEDAAAKINLLLDMKGEEFSDYVMEQAQNVEGVEINQKALDSKKLSFLVSDSNKNGTSSAASSAAESSKTAE